MKVRLLFVCAIVSLVACAGDRARDFDIASPDNNIKVVFSVVEGRATYRIFRSNTLVLDKSDLGLIVEGEDFTNGLVLLSDKSSKVSDDFTMFHGKRRNVSYTGNQALFQLKNASGKKFEIEFRVSNDGVAFKYNIFPSGKSYKVLRESTSFAFPASATAFLQPMSDPKTGWSQVNPCYEEFYKGEIASPAAPPTKSGWAFPTLFHVGENWVLLTEAGLRPNYCGSRLGLTAGSDGYNIQFPEALEAHVGKEFLPVSDKPFSSPWRIIVVGGLNTIIESDLGVVMADPATTVDTTFIRPGHASWSWALLKDDSTVYDVQKRFVDYAAAMGWDYCLVDADWDRKIGYERIAQLSRYAQTKGVGLLLWYNSAGDWNTTPYTPKSMLLTTEQREAEFSRLEKMGIKGVKVDFFGGDGTSMIQYYHDLLKDAAAHHLMVNLHGATIPRGWQRTYPNLMCAEAIKGFEYVTFEQVNADEQPRHCTIIPFTRNAFDPMDFTPLSLDSVPRITRRTTPTFELALSVIFLSGFQHFVERPSGMIKAQESVKDFLRTLPTRWDDSKFISGYPGKDVVIARRSGSKWYIAGINGENVPKTFAVDASFTGKSSATIFNDAKALAKMGSANVNIQKPLTVEVGGNGGFVIVIDDQKK